MGGRMYADTDRIRHFRATQRHRPRGRHGEVEVRYDDETRTTVDEIVTTQMHLEGMSDDAVWMEVNGLHVWFRAKRGKLIVTCFADTCKPLVVTKATSETGT